MDLGLKSHMKGLMNRTTKRTSTMYVRPAKTQVSLCIDPLYKASFLDSPESEEGAYCTIKVRRVFFVCLFFVFVFFVCVFFCVFFCFVLFFARRALYIKFRDVFGVIFTQTDATIFIFIKACCWNTLFILIYIIFKIIFIQAPWM